MTIRNLEYIFEPRSIALLGASRMPGSIGAVLARNLFNAGFGGPVMPVDANHRAVEGVWTYPDVASLPTAPDLAVIALRPDQVPVALDQLGQLGAKGAVIIGGGPGSPSGCMDAGQRQAMLDAAKPYLLRIVGPDCLGIMVPGLGVNASVGHIVPERGQLAFVAQSATMVTSVLDWASARGIGFSHFISLGDMSDVDFGDMLDYLANEGHVRGILLYIEAVTHARKFMSAARAAARLKPVIVIKSGRGAAAAAAAQAHTGTRASSDAVYDAAFRRAGMLRVREIGDLFDAVETLSAGRTVAGDRLVILTNSGGVGVMATDALVDFGGRLAPLSEETVSALEASLPAAWSHGNPVNILADATEERYAPVLETVLKERQADAVLVLHCPTALTSGQETARAVVRGGERARIPVLTCWLGGQAAVPARRLFQEHRLPTYATPERAVRAFMDLENYRRNQVALTQTPPSVPEAFSTDAGRVRRLVAQALDEGRTALNEAEAKAVFAAYGIPVVQTRIAKTPDEAAQHATTFATPVALKILSPDIPHKTDVGGVALALPTPRQVRERAESMMASIRKLKPDAHIEGFSVQPMVARPGAFELIISVTEDIQFGPVIHFGQGGRATEIVDDTALALPPLNMHLAREMMARTHVFHQLQGYRGQASAALDEIALTLIKVSQLVTDVAEIVALDINPLLADAFGVIALDAHMWLAATDVSPARRLAIRPYPKDLETMLTARDGRTYLLRPVLPEDEPELHIMFSHMKPEDIRMRFFAPKKALSHTLAARMTQIDYDREMTLVLTEPDIPGRGALFGSVSLNADPDGERGEFAITIRSDMGGGGLGAMLMQRIIDYGRARGMGEIFGEVLRENRRMLALCTKLGFGRKTMEDDPSIIYVSLGLSGTEPPMKPVPTAAS